LALTLPGTSRLTGVGRLRHKESDRAAVLIAEFAKLGAFISIDGDTLVIPGLTKKLISPVMIDPHGDHRIAMAAAVAALRFGPLEITGVQCVAKSYPTFFDDIVKLAN
jgi:3-phosphoshikimate 1-carboxyvinyltransferase